MKTAMSLYAAAIITPKGTTLYYTGRAGADYLSSNVTDAFFAYTRERAQKVADDFCQARNAGLVTDAYKALAILQPCDSEGGEID